MPVSNMRRGSPPKSNIDHDIFRLCGPMFILQPPNPTIIGAPHFPRVIIPNTASPLDEPSIGRVFLARSRQQIADRHAGAPRDLATTTTSPGFVSASIASQQASVERLPCEQTRRARDQSASAAPGWRNRCCKNAARTSGSKPGPLLLAADLHRTKPPAVGSP